MHGVFASIVDDRVPIAPSAPMTATVSLASTPVSASVPVARTVRNAPRARCGERDRVDRQVEQRAAGEGGVGQPQRAVG